MTVRPQPFHAHQLEFGIGLQPMCDDVLIFLAIEGAGGIDEPSSRPKHADSRPDNISLAERACLHMLGRPFLDRVRIFAEHPFAGAGRIQHNAVEAVREPFGQCMRIRLSDDAVDDAHPFHIFGQYFGPLRVDLVGDKQSFALHSPGNLRRLPPGAAARSSTNSPGCGSSSSAADMAEGSWM